MSSFIKDLQTEIMSPNCDIVNILRKAHFIASTLNLTDFDKWIMSELNGYPTPNDCPEYRILHCDLYAFNQFNGWMPTVFRNTELENLISITKMNNSISQIISMSEQEGDKLMSEILGELLLLLNECFNTSNTRFALFVSKTSIMDIIEKVKTTVLDWTIKLESEGILGENTTFSEQEKQVAATIPQTINNYYGNTNIVSSPTENMQIVSGNNNEVSFSYEFAKNAVEEIEDSISAKDISDTDKEYALSIIINIKNQIDNKNNPSTIKNSFNLLKEFLIGIGSSFAASAIWTYFHF